MNLLGVVTALSVYRSWSARKTFWEGKFAPVNMKHFGHHNVRKHRDIKNGEKSITLDISFNFGSLYKMKITSSEPKHYLVISVKGLIAYLVIKTIISSKKIEN